MKSEFIARILGMIVLGLIGSRLGAQLGRISNLSEEYYAAVIGLVGALFGLALTPLFTTQPVRALRANLLRVSAQTLRAGLTGLVSGLLAGTLLAYPISLLPDPFGQFLPFLGVILFGYLGTSIFIMRQTDIFSGLSYLPTKGSSPEGQEPGASRSILLDTSVIIDGRIADIAQTGFLSGALLIPRFVLNELQYIADSPDSLRRQRGRRGMEVISRLQKDPIIPVRISDIDVEGVREVDDKLVILARQLRSPILTNDYNLNRIAELQGVAVLNVNELANAVKLVLLPGENLTVNIIQEGREAGQGVGYLDDGTMVVVEDGRDYLHSETSVTVTKVLQTAAGRMIFAKVENIH